MQGGGGGGGQGVRASGGEEGHHVERKMLCVMWSDTAFYAAVAAPIGEPDTLLDVRRLVQGAERELAGGRRRCHHHGLPVCSVSLL